MLALYSLSIFFLNALFVSPFFLLESPSLNMNDVTLLFFCCFAFKVM